MNKMGDYFYVPKRARKRVKHADKMHSDTGMSQPIKAPKMYPETGPESSILPANKVETTPAKKMVDNMFRKLKVPDQNVGVGNVTTTTINPTSLG